MDDESKKDLTQALKRELQELQQMRDELRVQIHLAALEARDDWNELERKWNRIEDELGRLREQAKEPLANISEAGRGLMEDVKRGYTRIKGVLKR